MIFEPSCLWLEYADSRMKLGLGAPAGKDVRKSALFLSFLSKLGRQKPANDHALAPQPVKMREKALFFSSRRTRCSRGGGLTKLPAASSRKGRTGTAASFGGKGASAASCHTQALFHATLNYIKLLKFWREGRKRGCHTEYITLCCFKKDRLEQLCPHGCELVDFTGKGPNFKVCSGNVTLCHKASATHTRSFKL